MGILEDIGNWLGGYIYAGLIGGIVIAALILYCCIKHNMCPFQKRYKSNVHEEEQDPFLNAYYDEAANEVKPPVGTATVTEQDSGDDFHFSSVEGGNTDEQPENQPDQETSTVVPQPEDGPKNDIFIYGCKLKMTIMYKSKDLTLSLKLEEVSGIPGKSAGGYDLVLLSITLLPGKKKNVKTKMKSVESNGVARFGDEFKFANVARESLSSSMLRFRLYGKKSATKKLCFGEIFFKLLEVKKNPGRLDKIEDFQRPVPTLKTVPNVF